MLEKPDLLDDAIIACLRQSYQLSVAGLAFLPLGNDAYAWAYRVRTDDGESYFLKVRRGSVSEPAVTVPRHLRDSGIEQIIAPLPTFAQALWQRLGDFTLLLYPFIEGDNGMSIGLSESQWVEFGATLKRIHAMPLSAEPLRQVKRENFSPHWRDFLRAFQAKLQVTDDDDPDEKELAAFCQARREKIIHMVERAEALARRLQAQSPEFVLCHTDIHTANILLDTAGRLYIVDWDSPLIAPKERDLMFVMGGVLGVRAQDTSLFFQGYGKTQVDVLALAYYHYEWVVIDLAEYGKQVFLMPDTGAKNKRAAVQGFIEQFETGLMLDAAYNSENIA